MRDGTYRNRVVFGAPHPVDEAERVALEAELGQPLPDEYVEFLRVANGCVFEYSCRVPPSADGEAISFSDIYRLGRDQSDEYGWGTLLGEYRARSDGWLSEHVDLDQLLPIAGTGGGDTLFLNLRPESYGHVVGFVHGLPSWTGLRPENVISTLAPGFDEYVDRLFVEEDVAEMIWADWIEADRDDPERAEVVKWLDSGLPGWRTRAWAAPA